MNRLEMGVLYRPWMVAMLAFTVFACDGGGCSGCEGCGVRPIAGGYPIEERIANSAQVRLTSSGISFIEENINGIITTALGGGLEFNIPSTSTRTSGVDINVCPGSDCVAHLEVKQLDLTPVEPNRLSANLQIILDSRDTGGGRRGVPLRLKALCEDIPWVGEVCLVNTTCRADINTRRGSRDYIGFSANIDLHADTNAARLGYTRLSLANAGLASGQGIQDDDLDLDDCSGIDGAILEIAIDWFKGTFVDQIEDQADDLVRDTLREQLCTTRGAYGCPAGTYAVPDESPDSICRFGPSSNDECVPILLGADGEGDLGGALLGGFSPGTHAYGQFLLAAGGDGQAVNDGMTLNFYGGFRGTDRSFTASPAHHPCVPLVEPPPLPEIKEAAAFRGNVIPGTSTEAHVGIGIAEDYLNYVAYGLYDSGMLCIGAGTRLSQQLSTGLVSVLVMSLADLTFPNGSSPLTIAVRPQSPPAISIGSGGATDPLLQIALNTLQLDFYVWSTERYVRFMTFQTDLSIGVDLTVEGNQLVPTIHYISAENSSITNSELLTEQPAVLAGVLESIISDFAGMLTSGIEPFDLPSVMGFELTVPEGGITRVTEGDDDFLGIFANLAIPAAGFTAPVETSLEVSDLRIDRESMHPERWNQGEGNSVWLHMGAEGPLGVQYEYSYRINGGPWSPWTTSPRVRVEDDTLLLQARHRIEARARVVGEPHSVDPSPASVDLIVDILPPEVRAIRTATGVRVETSDIVTADDALEIRYRIGGEWTEWSHDREFELAYDDAGEIEVEVRDEAGNVGRAQAPLIRGLPNSSLGEGCGCSAPGAGGGTSLGWLGLAGMLGLVALRRRTRRGTSHGVLVAAALALGLVVSGCECSGGDDPCNGECRAARPPGNLEGQVCCPSTAMCVDYDLTELCDPGYECAVDDVVTDESCNPRCANCTLRPALHPGVLATYLDSIVDESGNVYVSGYSPGHAAGSTSARYGDLVFGTWNGTNVTWEIVDGAPAMPITNDPNGWRGGVSDPGPDVGRWTSLAKVGETFLISYYDATNGALKVAVGEPGAWEVHTVDDAGDSGRYSSLVVTPDGVPVIAYLRIQESTETPGQVMSTVMVATANIANPASSSDWTLTEVTSSPMPCRAQFCESSTTCLASGLCVTPTTDCPESCGSGDVCFNGSCVEALPQNYIEDLLPAVGLYTSLAVVPTGGLALVYYDRTAGNLHGVYFDGTQWGSPFLIDGYAVGDPFVGDSGQGADVTVDSAGVWHVAYIDGTEETLRYAQVQSTGTVLVREIVDDGSTDGTNRHTDGRHIVGDDASIAVLESGAVRIAYQDATAQNAVVAVRPAGGGEWTIAHVDTEASTGYWIDQEVLGTTSYLTMWWQARDGRDLSNGIRVLVAE